jgi:hypothetical protein
MGLSQFAGTVSASLKTAVNYLAQLGLRRNGGGDQRGVSKLLRPDHDVTGLDHPSRHPAEAPRLDHHQDRLAAEKKSHRQRPV